MKDEINEIFEKLSEEEVMNISGGDAYEIVLILDQLRNWMFGKK